MPKAEIQAAAFLKVWCGGLQRQLTYRHVFACTPCRPLLPACSAACVACWLWRSANWDAVDGTLVRSPHQPAFHRANHLPPSLPPAHGRSIPHTTGAARLLPSLIRVRWMGSSTGQWRQMLV